MGMITKRTVVSLLMFITITTLPAFAQHQQMQNVQNASTSQTYNNVNKANVSINWAHLNLTNDQSKKIKELDAQWERIQQLIRPKIIRDQQQLKNVMSNPNADEDLIRKLNNDIMLRQKQLRFEATENFLSKRRVLTTGQRETLHKMMIPQQQK